MNLIEKIGNILKRTDPWDPPLRIICRELSADTIETCCSESERYD